MKKFTKRKSLIAIALGLAVTSLSTSAFAATCPTTEYTSPYKGFTPVYVVYPYGQQLQAQQPYVQQPNVQQPYTQLPSQSPEIKVPDQKQGNQDQSAVKFANEVARLVNQERAKAGLQPLRLDSKLSAVAMDKAIDMSKNRYFDHISPTYGSPFDMMNRYGIQFSYAGENIAMGQQSPQEVMNQWMNSQGHRENILNPNYDTIGVAYYNGYWVQEFIKTR
jgi:uncharacterized YkwD family protein